jgi:hypothetical protein
MIVATRAKAVYVQIPRDVDGRSKVQATGCVEDAGDVIAEIGRGTFCALVFNHDSSYQERDDA